MSVGDLRLVSRQLRVLLGGRPLRSDERHRPFFIIGAPRSGTTLLRALLESHPALHMPPETSALPDAVRIWRWYGRVLAWTDVLRAVLGTFEFQPQWYAMDLPLEPVYRELAARPPDRRDLAAVLDALYRAHIARHKPAAQWWGEKTPGNTLSMDRVWPVFPDLRAIHIVRDGRDVVRSHMHLGSYTLEAAAARWLAFVGAGRAFGRRHPAQYLEIRYEQLVHDPGAVLPAVTGFLGVPFEPAMLRHHELALPLPDVARIPDLHTVIEPVHERAVGQWRSYFDAAQRAELDRLLGPTR